MLSARHLTIAALILTWSSAAAVAQQRASAAEVVNLTTRDGVQLTLSYFPSALAPGTDEAKQVTPVILLHDFKGTRATFNSLAQRLQSPADRQTDAPAFAVVTVDLRAHGDSMRQVFPTGEAIDLDASRLRRDDYVRMATLDMEAVRNFLVGKNDAGELNLNKLCLVGAGMGASVAANWALQDWRMPPLAIGKQGQDVKALVLVSPPWQYSGLALQVPLRFRPLAEQVAWMLVYGAEDPRATADVGRIRKQLERLHPEVNGARERLGSFHVASWPSKLQGDTLLQQAGEALEAQIVAFLVENVARTDEEWINRRGRLP